MTKATLIFVFTAIASLSGVAQAGSNSLKAKIANYILDNHSNGKVCPERRWSCSASQEATRVAFLSDGTYGSILASTVYRDVTKILMQWNQQAGTNYQVDWEGLQDLLFRTCRTKFVTVKQSFHPDTGELVRSKESVEYGEMTSVACFKKNIGQILK